MRKRRENILFDELEMDFSLNGDDRNSPDNKGRKNSIHHLPFYAGILLLLGFLGIFGVVYVIDNQLPTPLKLADELDHPDSFIAERARDHLKVLTDFGPRIVGSHENEVLTVDFLKKVVNNIISEAHANQLIELDVQVVSGSYYLDSVPVGKINTYSNVQNVVVKLHGRDGANSSLLLNSHFDSVPTSPGGSDDGINCAAMLEVLNKFSKRSERPLHNVVFLFNGAEETSLQAAHGFITQHKWAKECKAVVNAEAAGAGGKIFMFQTGPDRPWVTRDYAKVPYPAGQSSGEELFQANLIPSDTDFRIFRDFGHLVGIDMAFTKNGYVYHTKYDGFDNIPFGSYQHVGEHLMSLVQNMANDPELSNESPEVGKIVYFDYLGKLFISYTTSTGTIINLVVVVLSFVMFAVSLWHFNLGLTFTTFFYLLKTVSAILFGWIAAIFIVMLIAFFLDTVSYSMSWYANPWLLFGLYVIPTISGASATLLLVSPKNLSVNINSQIQAHIIRLIWTTVLLVGTILGIRSTFAIMLIVSFNCLAFVVIHLFRLHHSVIIWKVIYMVVHIIPTVFLMYATLLTIGFFIPITGRFGSNRNPEVIIGFITYLMTLLIMSPMISFISLLKKPLYFLLSLKFVFVVFLIIVFTPLGFPYNGSYNSPAPQRFWILHSSRTFHGKDGGIIKQDSGYFFLNMDRNSPTSVKKYVDQIQMATSVTEDCENFLLCGLPLAHPKMVQIIEYSSWIPAPPPITPGSVGVVVNSKTTINSTLLRYNISISGPDHNSIFISPKKYMEIVKMNLLEEMPYRRSVWNGRALYFFVHCTGIEATPLELILDVQVPKDYKDSTMDIAVAGSFVHEKTNVKTPGFNKFLDQFPDWADLTAWLAAYESWII